MKRDLAAEAKKLEKFPDKITVCPDYLSITGSEVWREDGEPNDVDVVVKEQADKFTPGVWLKVTRLIKDLLGPDKIAHLIEAAAGPCWDHIPLYDLALVRQGKLERKCVDSEQLKERLYKADSALMQQAETSAKENKVELNRFFLPAKPMKGYKDDQPQTVDNFLALVPEDAFPVHSEKKYDGVNIEVHKDGEKVRIFTEDGTEITSQLSRLISEGFKNLKIDRAVLLAELELWSNNQHLPRESVAGYLGSKDPEPEGLVANVYDLVFLGENDLHGRPHYERRAALDKIKFPQSTMHEPETVKRLNLSPQFISKNKAELKTHTERLCSLPGSEGNVAKFSAAPYSLNGQRTGMIKFHNAAVLQVEVLDRKETKVPGTFNLEIGIKGGGLKGAPASVVLGKTMSTSLPLQKGDVIDLETETLNYEKHPDQIEMSAWVPRVLGKSRGPVMTAEQAIGEARRNRVLQEKIIKDGVIFYKQDALIKVPSEDKKWKFVIQHHYRGKSAHADFRVEQDDRLVGFTMFDLLPDSIKDPVETLSEAKRIDGTDSFKIDWKSGNFKSREVAGGEVRRTDVRSTPKKPEPLPWLKVEGVVEPGETGATADFPGVFSIIDEGQVEYGSQKPFFHEYFLEGKKLKGRLLFRLLSREDAEKRDADKILPPAEAEEVEREPFFWVAMQPIDQTPSVLSKSSIEKKWLPPPGVSALPKQMRDNVPEKLQYWKEKDKEKALAMREELAGFEELGGVKIQKADGNFRLFRRWFKGQVVVRFGPSTELFELLIDHGADTERWTLQGNPAKEVKTGGSKESGPKLFNDYKTKGNVFDLKPGSGLNPTKNTPGFIELLDSGKLSVLEDGEDLKKVRFFGKDLNGVYILSRDQPGEGTLWNIERTQAAPKTKIDKRVKFCKVDAEKRLVYGVVYEAGVVDTQGEETDLEDLEQGAHKFMENFGSANEMHQRGLSRMDAAPVESVVLAAGDVFQGVKFNHPSWIVVTKIYSDSLWEKIQSGEYTGYSMEGDAEYAN
jgi:hypothetical protein